MAAIQGIQLSKSYHHYQVLKEISLEVSPGDCYVLIGPNGAGKTTLLRILATLQNPSSGRFEIMGHDGVKERDKIREVLLLVAHGSYLYDELNAEENIRFAMGLRGLYPTDHEIKIALDRVGIGAFKDLKTRYFSMGMKRRLSIARATLIRPKVLLLDEPYSSLDENGMTMVNSYIREITQQGASVLLTTHNRVKSAEVGHRAGALVRGELKEIGMKDLTAKDDLL
ncbi:MAG TPA: heme ABC exporter ATP-binding protein CcmA [Nitrospiria bacterium]|jgi:heme ABC exporter ATP-binding subunit CcmA|nr:heme ABC exporter ATP-binding protein CcmA [Nitrospiria bacterium]